MVCEPGGFSFCFFMLIDFQDDDGGSAVSIFSLSGSNALDGHLAAGRNGVKRLRTVSLPFLYLFIFII